MTKAKGSTTATMAFLTQDKQLKTCNIGDSGYLLLRRGESGNLESVFRSTSQQHYFNCPYQFGIHNKKPPSDQAFSTVHLIEENDILVLGTDGLWDNLFDQDIIDLI